MKQIKILWTDDEIDILKPHIIFLEEKGYKVLTSSNADDAVSMLEEQDIDIIFLDENMPGKSGLEILPVLKNIAPEIPVIMITKSEEENIMEEAIGSQIDDYLIKPVNPKQILLTIMKFIDQKKLISKKTISSYQSGFGEITALINHAVNFDDWIDIYKKLVFWEMELEKSETDGMQEVLRMQNVEANQEFSKFIKKNYLKWVNHQAAGPILSPNLFSSKIFPLIEKGEKVVVMLIDNFRYDQWKAVYPILQDIYRVEEEEIYCSILPTATQYARNAIFSGLMPLDIQQTHPQWWFFDEDTESKNQFEALLLEKQIERSGKKFSFHYEKVNNPRTGQKLVEQFSNYLNNSLIVVVYNFVDMLSHARTESEMIRELAGDEKAYRSITQSWFNHSPILDVIKILSEHNIKLIITTDHGTIRVNHPLKVVGDKKTSANLRYKTGKSLNYNPKEVFEIINPEEAALPRSNMSSRFIFALNDDFLIYPQNYNYYVSYYKNSFQHGGISLQEMLIPYVLLNPKG